MGLKAIIYDFDGVICDSVNVKTEAFASMYSIYGPEVVKGVIRYHLDNGGVSRYEKFKYFHREFLNINLNEEQVFNFGEEFSKLVKQKVIDSIYILNADKFIKESFGSVMQFICTGTPQVEILEILNSKDILQYFSAVYGSPRNKIEIISEILSVYKLKESECVFFGDALTDYYASKHHNMPFIGVKNEETDFPFGTKEIQNFENLNLEQVNLYFNTFK